MTEKKKETKKVRRVQEKRRMAACKKKNVNLGSW